MSLENTYEIITIIFRVIFVVAAIFSIDKIVFVIAGFFPGKKFPKANKQYKYALLVPARNESKVIESLLKSIAAQTYPRDMFDIFVVVEDENDPTCEICKKYNARITVRKHLHLQSKGYALDELLTDMYENGYKNKYDAYFIIDADNYLSPNFIEELNKAYCAGYDIGLGYRNNKNWNNWVSASSALSFTIANTFQNKLNSKLEGAMLITGTGFYIDAKIIDELGGWKFHGLTEDVELGFFAALNNLKSTYCPDAVFYDEQPTKLAPTIKQRTRWLRGYFQASKKYHKKIIGSIIKEKEGRVKKLFHIAFILPVIALIVFTGVYGLISLGFGIGAAIAGLACGHYFFVGAMMLLTILIGLYVFNLLCILAELKNMDITRINILKTFLLGPIFLILYLPVFVIAIFKKEVKWDAIEHNVDFSLPTKE